MTRMEFILRAPDEDELKEISEKVNACFQSAAQATGCSVDVTTTTTAKNIVTNEAMLKVYREYAESFGESRLTI